MNPSQVDDNVKAAWSDRLLGLPAAVQLGLWMALVLLLKFESLLEPPVWDSAMGVFPPAIYLYESGFDIRALLQEGNWWIGGPNVHSLSLLTWFIAMVMTVTQSATATFAIVHASTFALVAWSLQSFTRVLSQDGYRPTAVLSAAALLLMTPLVLVQVGYLYTESWVMALGVLAWAGWRENRPATAVLFCVLALCVKLTAIAIVACLVLALVLSRHHSLTRRIAFAITLPIAFWAVRALPNWLGAAPVPAASWGDPTKLARALIERLGEIPDVSMLLAAGMVSALLYAAGQWRRGGRLGNLSSLGVESSSELICLAMPFVFFAGITAALFTQNIFLPRYLVPIVPFSIASILIFARSIDREKWACGIFIVGCLLGVANSSGLLYPPDHERFSIVERSHAYHDFHDLQIEVIEAFAEMPPSLPVFVSKEVDYMVSHPMMGYVDRPMPNVESIYLPPHSDRPLADFPDEFLLVFSNPHHGGAEIVELVRAAQQDPAVEMRSRLFERAGFKAALFWIHRTTEGDELARTEDDSTR